jgi:hypothetical protein
VLHRPTPKGFYAITEELLREIPIPPPQKKAAVPILDIVSRLVKGLGEQETTRLEEDLESLVEAALRA